MKKASLISRLLKKIFLRLGISETREISKKGMCERAIKSSVCPKTCEICAWNEDK